MLRQKVNMAVSTRKGEFQINAFTRTLNDQCEISQHIRDSSGPGNYMTNNLVPKSSDATNLATNVPTLLGREGYGYNNAHIDTDSRLRNDMTQAGRNKCPLHVQSRPFASVPFMGNGRGNPDIESALLYSDFSRIERPCGTVTETFLEGQFTPLVPHLAAHIQNPTNLLPEDAAAGWIRSGIPSRQYMRDINM